MKCRAIACMSCFIALVTSAFAQTDCGDGSVFTDVPMTDGTLIRTRVALPSGDGPWPVILTRTPYSDAELCWSKVNEITAYGYAHVNQSTRGRNGSGGEYLPFVHDAWGEHQDGYDTVEWILQQPWCNGVIGVYGGSLRAGIANMMAGSGPPHMYGEWLARGPADFYRNGVLYYGGALRWDEFEYMRDQFGSLLESTILEHPSYDSFWQGLDVTTRQHLRDHPVIIWAGWYDTYLQSSLDNYMTIRSHGGAGARENSKLIIALTGHSTLGGDIVWPEGSDGPGIDYGRTLMDDYLKGENDFGDRVPRVAYYLMGDFDNPGAPGNEWRFVDDWPVPAVDTSLYLHAGGSLQKEAPPFNGLSATYTFDPSDPVPTLGGAVHAPPMGTLDQRPVETRPDVLLFETAPLPAPVEVVGKIDVRLWASSDAPDTDFTAKLTDVYPGGKSIIVTDGIIRARARHSLTDHNLMTPGTIYEFGIDLWSTAIVFDQGHRIRLAISSSNFPRFAVNPNTGADLAVSYDVTQAAENTVYFDASRPSHLILPITGPDGDGDTVADWLDAFPHNTEETEDADGDGMGDNFEMLIVNADTDDAILTIHDVLQNDDFDHDGNSNAWEFIQHTDPTDPSSVMPFTAWAIGTLVAGLGMLAGLRGFRRHPLPPL